MAETVKAIASLLWPLLAFAVLATLYRPLVGLLGDLGKRGGALKFGEFELTLPQVAEQQQVLLTDLQAQIAELRGRLAEPDAAASMSEGAQARRRTRILWVDDYPANNAVLQASLSEQGFDIANALSTEEGLRLHAQEAFDIVISDMGRGNDRTAGLALARAIRQVDAAKPLAIYCSPRAIKGFGGQAAEAGVDLITASATELLEFLTTHGERHA